MPAIVATMASDSGVSTPPLHKASSDRSSGSASFHRGLEATRACGSSMSMRGRRTRGEPEPLPRRSAVHMFIKDSQPPAMTVNLPAAASNSVLEEEIPLAFDTTELATLSKREQWKRSAAGAAEAVMTPEIGVLEDDEEEEVTVSLLNSPEHHAEVQASPRRSFRSNAARLETLTQAEVGMLEDLDEQEVLMTITRPQHAVLQSPVRQTFSRDTADLTTLPTEEVGLLETLDQQDVPLGVVQPQLAAAAHRQVKGAFATNTAILTQSAAAEVGMIEDAAEEEPLVLTADSPQQRARLRPRQGVWQAEGGCTLEREPSVLVASCSAVDEEEIAIASAGNAAHTAQVRAVGQTQRTWRASGAPEAMRGTTHYTPEVGVTENVEEVEITPAVCPNTAITGRASRTHRPCVASQPWTPLPTLAQATAAISLQDDWQDEALVQAARLSPRSSEPGLSDR